MNLKYLEYAAETVRAGSINKAAARLMLSQPYLSGCLKNLEDDLGFPIMVRAYDGVHLTEKGLLFMDSVEIILQEMDHIKQLAADHDEIPLSIATFPLSDVMKIFLDFKKLCKVKLHDALTEYIDRDVYETVASGRCRLGIVMLISGQEAEMEALLDRYGLYSQELIPAHPFYIAASSTHPFAARAQVSQDELLHHPLVCYNVPHLEKYLHWAGLSELPEDSLVVSDRGQFFDALMSGGFYATIIRWSDLNGRGLHFIPLPHKSVSASLHYICRRNHKPDSREQRFLEYLRSELAQRTMSESWHEI